MPAHGAMFGSQEVFHYSISSNGVQNLFTKAGSPNYRGDFVFVVDPGVVLGCVGVSSPTMRVPNSFVVGSTLKLIILGWMVSCGGNAGNGGGLNGGGQVATRAGNVIELSYPLLTIDVSQGFLSTGGSGGHGGAGATASFPPYPTTSGGGGGGGQGSQGGAAGSPGGTPGTINAPGVGGQGEGQVPGDQGYGGAPWGVQLFNVSGTAYTIKLNGNTVAWIGNHDSTHVKGIIA